MYTGYERELACQHRADALEAAAERRLVREIRQAMKGEITPTPGLVLWFRRVLHQAHAHLPRSSTRGSSLRVSEQPTGPFTDLVDRLGPTHD